MWPMACLSCLRIHTFGNDCRDAQAREFESSEYAVLRGRTEER
jgi:hypothetical protein